MGDRSVFATIRRVQDKYWRGIPTGHIDKPPDLLNNEALQSVNAAGTALVDLIKADGSNVVTLPNGVTVPAAKTLTVAGALNITGTATLPETALRYATVTINAADIVATTAGKFGHAAGYPLVADPGAGKAVELVSCILSYTHVVAAFGGGGNTTVNTNGGSAQTGVVAAAAFCAAGASSITQLVPLAATCIVLTANKGLNLVTASAFTQPGTAAGSIKAFVTYRVHTIQ